MTGRVTTPLLALLLIAVARAQRLGEAPELLDVDYYCQGRDDNEFFRREPTQDETELDILSTCGTYYRCIPASAGKKSISVQKCQTSMVFDVERQICDIRNRVDNCLEWEKYRNPRPYWPLADGEVSNCQGTDIQCGSGECKAKELFCDGFADCADDSDEYYCNPDTDPNAAEPCDDSKCLFTEGCFCSPDGTQIPNRMEKFQTPQMITVTFSGAVNSRNSELFHEIFSETAKNKGNDCTAKATFFVSHAFTNYSAVQELHRRGHEIAVNSITNSEDKLYWDRLPATEYEHEFDGARLITEKFANISQGEIMGMRVPGGRAGGNEQFRMMVDWGFLYDSSLAAPRGRLPLWPYTLMHRMPHKCIGTDMNCPSRNFTVWEMVLNELDRRDDVIFDESLTGCYYVDQCANIATEQQFRQFLDNNLAHHYNTNRAPIGLHFTAAYFETHPKFLNVFKKWVKDTAALGDYYFVTMQQVIAWMEAPTELAAINNFQEWKSKCDVKGIAYCSLPNPCEYQVRGLFPQRDTSEPMYLHTCEECPRTYPWLYDPYGQGLSNFDI